jgi:hypothetical protein
VNPEEGSGRTDLQIDFAIHTGDDVARPCPRCNGLALGEVGSCEGGPRDGQPCTVDATHGPLGNTSFDCPPSPGARVGSSLLPLDLTTEGSSIAPRERCTGSGNPGQQCYCAGQERQNACTGGTCIVADGFFGEGECVDGPVDQTCLIETFRGCTVDADCPALNDSCNARTRECLGATDEVFSVGPISRRGEASRTDPLLAGTFCIDATSSAAVNTAVGLPGPGAVRLPTVACVKDVCP